MTGKAETKNAGKGPLSPELLDKMNAYWRAANYLSAGQIYLKDNPLLERPLTLDDVKPRLQRRRAHTGSPGRRQPSSRPDSRSAYPRGQRGGFDGPPAAVRASAWAAGRGIRSAVPSRRPGGLRIPRLSGGDSPPHLPAAQPRQHPRARLQGRGRHHPLRYCVLNNIDLYQLALDDIRRVPRMASKIDAAEQWYSEAIQRHRLYVTENGDNLPEIKD